MLTENIRKVLLPDWVIKAVNVNEVARQYLVRYEGYELIKVKGSFAICRKE